MPIYPLKSSFIKGSESEHRARAVCRSNSIFLGVTSEKTVKFFRGVKEKGTTELDQWPVVSTATVTTNYRRNCTVAVGLVCIVNARKQAGTKKHDKSHRTLLFVISIHLNNGPRRSARSSKSEQLPVNSFLRTVGRSPTSDQSLQFLSQFRFSISL